MTRQSRVYRGGSWIVSLAQDLRASFRGRGWPLDRGYGLGFRCARDLEAIPNSFRVYSDRAVRGGSWLNVYARALRSSYRYRLRPVDQYDVLGFRCVRSLPPRGDS